MHKKAAVFLYKSTTVNSILPVRAGRIQGRKTRFSADVGGKRQTSTFAPSPRREATVFRAAWLAATPLTGLPAADRLYCFSVTPCSFRPLTILSTTSMTSALVSVRSEREKVRRTVMDLPVSSV